MKLFLGQIDVFELDFISGGEIILFYEAFDLIGNESDFLIDLIDLGVVLDVFENLGKEFAHILAVMDCVLEEHENDLE